MKAKKQKAWAREFWITYNASGYPVNVSPTRNYARAWALVYGYFIPPIKVREVLPRRKRR